MRIRLAGLAVSTWLAIGALGAQSAGALTPGSFAPTGSMTAPRGEPAAAPLPDGRVLVAGGFDFDPNAPAVLNCQSLYCYNDGLVAQQSAEIFDPATGSFAPTGSMTVRRLAAAAAPLPDGRVLVAGGTDYDGSVWPGVTLQSAEIFDPATGSFSPAGAMTVPRTGSAAAPLPDGRVLVAGGAYYDGSDVVYLQTAEIFDPATGSFAPTGVMTVPRGNAAAAPLPDGRVLVAGGYYYSQPDAEIFDPATGSFAPTGSMIVHLSPAAAAPLPDGRVVVAGSDYEQSAEIFDPASGSFSYAGSMSNQRSAPAAAALPDGRVLVAGGYNYYAHSSAPKQSAELFTPALSFGLKGRKLTVTVAVAGTLTAADANTAPGGSAAARKRRSSLKPSSVQGGPGPITLKLKLAKTAKRILKRSGELKIRARLSFAPVPRRGNCVTVFSPCYSSGYAISEIATLTLKAKKRR